MTIKTTSQVAEKIGVTRQGLLAFINRHKTLKPSAVIDLSGDFLWSEDDINRLVEARKTLSKGGRPKGSKGKKKTQDDPRFARPRVYVSPDQSMPFPPIDDDDNTAGRIWIALECICGCNSLHDIWDGGRAIVTCPNCQAEYNA